MVAVGKNDPVSEDLTVAQEAAKNQAIGESLEEPTVGDELRGTPGDLLQLIHGDLLKPDSPYVSKDVGLGFFVGSPPTLYQIASLNNLSNICIYIGCDKAAEFFAAQRDLYIIGSTSINATKLRSILTKILEFRTPEKKKSGWRRF